MLTEEDQAIRDAVRYNTAAWLEGFGKIQKKTGAIEDAVCNEYQSEISKIVEWCAENNRPCRLVLLKPRQRGSSTISVAAGYKALQASRKRGLIAGGAHTQGENLFKILKVYAENDSLDPKSCTVLDTVARFKNGSEMSRVTLANPIAGRSGTYQVLIITEVAYLAEEGVANAEDVLNGLLKCVPLEPGTIIILESTANGRSGVFFETYDSGITFEELKEGKNGYVKVFAAWYEFSDLRLNPESEGIYSEDDYSAKEKELAAKYSLDMRQVAWMRYAIANECQGSFDRFQQDYPFNDQDCFLRSGRSVFNLDGLDHQRDIAKNKKGFTEDFCTLEFQPSTKSVLARPCPEPEAMVVRFERPMVGCKYILSCDPATGASQTGGKDPDSHSVFVLRAGYIDGSTRQWVEPAVAMRNILYKDGEKFGNWWEIDFLAERIYEMAKYYGNCPIIVETNKDKGLVELLKLKPDANIWVRTIFNQRENTETKAYGWDTNEKTRGLLVTNLQRAVREAGKGKMGEGLQIRSEWALKQMANFVVSKGGRAEAAQGHHDDDVLCLGIGCSCLDAATTYHEHHRQPWIPPDLRDSRVDNRLRSGYE